MTNKFFHGVFLFLWARQIDRKYIYISEFGSGGMLIASELFIESLSDLSLVNNS